MTNRQAATHESWLFRCSPCALEFSQSNQLASISVWPRVNKNMPKEDHQLHFTNWSYCYFVSHSIPALFWFGVLFNFDYSHTWGDPCLYSPYVLHPLNKTSNLPPCHLTTLPRFPPCHLTTLPPFPTCHLTTGLPLQPCHLTILPSFPPSQLTTPFPFSSFPAHYSLTFLAHHPPKDK